MPSAEKKQTNTTEPPTTTAATNAEIAMRATWGRTMATDVMPTVVIRSPWRSPRSSFAPPYATVPRPSRMTGSLPMLDGRPTGRVRVVVHGIDLDAVRATADRAGVRHELGIADDHIVVVCAANLRCEKSLGVPVVATAAGGVPAAVGRAGLISPVGDATALAANHRRVAGDPAYRDELATAARLEAPRFERTRAIAEIDAVYAAAIDGARAADSSHS